MRPIDADAFEKFIKEKYKDGEGTDDIKDQMLFDLSYQPTIEAVPVVHGEWEWFEEWMPSTTENLRECEDCGWRCNQCKTTLYDMVGGYWDNPDEQPKISFCPNCGAKMKGGTE